MRKLIGRAKGTIVNRSNNKVPAERMPIKANVSDDGINVEIVIPHFGNGIVKLATQDSKDATYAGHFTVNDGQLAILRGEMEDTDKGIMGSFMIGLEQSQEGSRGFKELAHGTFNLTNVG